EPPPNPLLHPAEGEQQFDSDGPIHPEVAALPHLAHRTGAQPLVQAVALREHRSLEHRPSLPALARNGTILPETWNHPCSDSCGDALESTGTMPSALSQSDYVIRGLPLFTDGSASLWGSKTMHRWLACGFTCGGGRGAGSIAGFVMVRMLYLMFARL